MNKLSELKEPKGKREREKEREKEMEMEGGESLKTKMKMDDGGRANSDSNPDPGPGPGPDPNTTLKPPGPDLNWNQWGHWSQKVTPDHLNRNAYLYIRQSTLKQVMENTESTRRQYSLRERGIALGWSPDQIVVIDSDQGQSGTSTLDRKGFKRLVSEVGMGHAGVVIGLEVSRLARNSSDWHRLLEICALTYTLILDEDGVYDPCHFNDRLLLGLKGTMSEAELHVLKSRLRGGVLAKARRGELRVTLPIGFIYDENEAVILDPDKQIQQSLHLLFETFRRVGTVIGTVKYFYKKGLKFPRRPLIGAYKGMVHWDFLDYKSCLRLLHNPRYAGAFFYGRLRNWRSTDGRPRSKILPISQWHCLIKDSHEGYISWQEFEENQKRIRENACMTGADRRTGVVREGPALLQGLIVCGICGHRMTVRYHTYKGELIPGYYCEKDNPKYGKVTCQKVPGTLVDRTIGDLLIQSVSPLALETALQVQEELLNRIEQTDQLRRQQVERAKYEADLARRRYMNVDPENRLVAGTLEAEWNTKLRQFTQAQEEYDRQCQKDRLILDKKAKDEILSLSTNFAKVWNNENTSYREKKRMVRLLLEDVTALKEIKSNQIKLYIRFKGGANQALTLPGPKKINELLKTNPKVIAEMEKLLKWHKQSEVAEILNKKGFISGTGKSFTTSIVDNLIRKYGLKTHYQHLREKGLLTLDEISSKLQLHPDTINKWVKKKLIKAHRWCDNNEYLYEWPGAELIKKLKEGKVLRKSKAAIEKIAERISEVQYGT